MTTYTAIPDTDIDQDSPGTVTVFTQLRDNPIAITEGASGAPNVRIPDVLRTPAAGAVNVLQLVGSTPITTLDADTTYEANSYARVGTLGTIGVTVLVAGVIRVELSHARNGALGASDAKVMKNDVSQGSWTVSSATYSSRSVDVTVAKGDIITIMHRNTNSGSGSNMKSARIRADANDLVVV